LDFPLRGFGKIIVKIFGVYKNNLKDRGYNKKNGGRMNLLYNPALLYL
jgi:hypothetical protein